MAKAVASAIKFLGERCVQVSDRPGKSSLHARTPPSDEIEADHEKRLARKLVICVGCEIIHYKMVM
jgi:hypothetical protein